MQAIQDATRRILSLAQKIHGLNHDRLDEAAREARAIETDLNVTAQQWLTGTPDADQVRIGVQFSQAAIETGPAVMALDTASAWCSRPISPALLDRVNGINLRLAQGCLLNALQPLSRVLHTEAALTPPYNDPSITKPSAEVRRIQAPEAKAADINILRNIATYHREHERYYTQNITEAAADLYREANKLRILARVWTDTAVENPAIGIDYSDPQYQAAGCVDLNALQAIPTIGVLFMEGEGEPAEIRVMRGKLQGLAGGWYSAGQWLADKMSSAWVREQTAFTPSMIDVAQARFNTIATNWRGSRETTLAGRILNVAVTMLQRIDFRPSAIRANRRAIGNQLLHAAWVIAMAGQIQARSGANLAENDRNWTAYLDGLPQPQSGA